MSHKAHYLLAFISTALIVALTLTGFALYRADAGPDIQGKLVQPGRSVSDFQLTDHNNQPFTEEDLKGRWHLVSYGFTHCPDICPSTLAGLNSVLNQVDEAQRYNNLDLLFFSVDPQRDTPAHLADYVEFFSPRLTGLTLSGESGENPDPFEQTLGILYNIPETDRFGDPYPEGNYPVNHGVDIFLINPRGELQSILEADYNEHGMLHFSTERLFEDYIAIREYLGSV